MVSLEVGQLLELAIMQITPCKTSRDDY